MEHWGTNGKSNASIAFNGYIFRTRWSQCQHVQTGSSEIWQNCAKEKCKNPAAQEITGILPASLPLGTLPSLTHVRK